MEPNPKPQTDPASPVRVCTKDFTLLQTQEETMRKPLNKLLSAIPYRHLLSFADAVDSRSLRKAIKANLGGNEASKEDANESFHQTFLLSTKVKAVLRNKVLLNHNKYPKRYTQAAQARFPTAPNYASHSDEIICSFFAQQASMPTTQDDEDLLQIDEDVMEEINIRWQVAMITARIKESCYEEVQKGPIDLKPKNG
ncbi:hypothetical protein Tco_1250914 [Tanacetum coccineum]